MCSWPTNKSRPAVPVRRTHPARRADCAQSVQLLQHSSSTRTPSHMAAFTCCSDGEGSEQRRLSRLIDNQLADEKKLMRRQVKLLLLGTGESGKSTFLKQMYIIHGVQFDSKAIDEYRLTIYQNVLRGVRVLMDARAKLGIAWGRESNAALEAHIVKMNITAGSRATAGLNSHVFTDLVPILREIWLDDGIQAAFARRHEYQLADSVKFFLDNLERIGTRHYTPSNQDILLARKASKGASEFTVVLNNVPFMFVDVGGQRSQRQKWFVCFENVTSILFLVSSCEFDQVLLEDRCTNRLIESCTVFDTIVNNRIFSNTAVMLFFNKTDLLREKLARSDVSISSFFGNFAGDPHSLCDVQHFLLDMFKHVCREPRAGGCFHRPLFHHYTTAIDTHNISVVFAAVKDTILRRNLESLMLQ